MLVCNYTSFTWHSLIPRMITLTLDTNPSMCTIIGIGIGFVCNIGYLYISNNILPDALRTRCHNQSPALCWNWRDWTVAFDNMTNMCLQWHTGLIHVWVTEGSLPLSVRRQSEVTCTTTMLSYITYQKCIGIDGTCQHCFWSLEANSYQYVQPREWPVVLCIWVFVYELVLDIRCCVQTYNYINKAWIAQFIWSTPCKARSWFNYFIIIYGSIKCYNTYSRAL